MSGNKKFWLILQCCSSGEFAFLADSAAAFSEEFVQHKGQVLSFLHGSLYVPPIYKHGHCHLHVLSVIYWMGTYNTDKILRKNKEA